MFDNSGLVKLRRMGAVMYCWIKNATRRKKEPCPKCQKRKVHKMLSLQPSAMERLNYELALQRDRFVRLQSVQKDFALDLPHSIPLPDGEEIPYGSSIRLKIRDPQQESEITQTCIRPPPNRTISETEPLPPYVHLLAGGKRQSSKKAGDIFERTARCFGMKRAEEPITLPPPPPPLCVYVPINRTNRSRQLAAFAENGSMDLSSVPSVSCAVPAQYLPASRSRETVPDSYAGDKFRSHFSGLTTGASARASALAETPGAAAVTSASAVTSTAALTSTSAVTSAAAMKSASAISSASALSDYIDTKGPETRAERMASAYYAGEYRDTMGPERSYAAMASESSTSEQRDTSGEKKTDKGSV